MLIDKNNLLEPLIIDFPVEQKILDEAEIARKAEVRLK